MRAATLAETDALIEAGDAMAERLRELLLLPALRAFDAADGLARLVDAYSRRPWEV